MPTKIEWAEEVLCALADFVTAPITLTAQGLNVEPVWLFVSAMMVILMGLFAAIKTWKRFCAGQSPSFDHMIYGMIRQPLQWITVQIKANSTLPSMVAGPARRERHCVFCGLAHFDPPKRRRASFVRNIFSATAICAYTRKAIAAMAVTIKSLLELPRAATMAPFFSASKTIGIFSVGDANPFSGHFQDSMMRTHDVLLKEGSILSIQ